MAMFKVFWTLLSVKALIVPKLATGSTPLIMNTITASLLTIFKRNIHS